MKITNLIHELPWKKGASWKKRTIFDIEKVYVHHSGVNGGNIFKHNYYHISPGNHISSAGCPHVCYHLYIDMDGDVSQCNYLTDITWHIGADNDVSIGILVEGNFINTKTNTGSRINPTIHQLVSLKKLLRMLEKFPNVERENILAHEEYPAYKGRAYGCPGDKLTEFIKSYREG